MKVWKTIPCDGPLAIQLASTLDLPLPVAEMLMGRGYQDMADIERFLNPRLSDLSDPFLLPDMEPAARRLQQAILADESIAVYGDYDVDGIVSTGLLVQVLHRLGARMVTPCLPSRQEEGYGLSLAALKRCMAQCRPSLLITVDCGTNDTEAVHLAQAAGIDVVITDHHESNGQKVEALAVVNPKLGQDNNLKVLAGVGVVFKLCHGLLKIGRNQGLPVAQSVDLREYLDFVAVGTVADIVPLIGENRILVRHGLIQMNQSLAPRWKSLVDIAGIRGAIDAQHIGYGLGPRLNAAGRMGNADTSLELLLTDNMERAHEIAVELDGANRERQKIESEIVAEAMREIDANFNEQEHYGLVISKTGWHTGVIGIVASRLVARYRRPVVVVAFDPDSSGGRDGVGRGSCRSIEGYHLLNGLERCRQFLITYGGHEMAAGLEIKRDQYEAFRTAFNQAVKVGLAGRDLRPIQRINTWITLDQVNDSLFAAMEALRPFGQDNPVPVLAVRGVRIQGQPRRVGVNHLRFMVGDGRTSRSAIAFRMADITIPEGPLDVAFTFQKNTFMGNETLELNVQDIRKAE
ncbi:MAG: single-stranded-DNA-specific exonuclease RecJ [Verrucomicrobia bacterium]|nr:single-stranded-DNA-specific exonuclease RecJ [Verrucomicrobiota bacterium]MBU1735380.1 single-stranded-DNA-specific exonuclease RecJ [Verrucomicrobiota bacterium]MBU1857465.1 single-stranded-DNA-specific exonuclease RecJ [Verrucomicrobiota bacterium]